MRSLRLHLAQLSIKKYTHVFSTVRMYPYSLWCAGVYVYVSFVVAGPGGEEKKYKTTDRECARAWFVYPSVCTYVCVIYLFSFVLCFATRRKEAGAKIS